VSVSSAFSSLFNNMGHARRPKRLAEKLLQIRKALGWSQKEMAERLSKQAGGKITYRNVSKYERDKSVPYIEIVLAYARLANVEMNQIVDDDLDIEPTEWPEFIEADLT
jgi:transcriptional regulator with XRE-family HTH domain